MPLDYAGAALGVAFGGGFADFRVVVKNVVDRARMFKPILKRLESTLDRLAPTVIEIGRLSEQLTLPEVETKSLIEHMKKGENLVRKCSKIPWWNYLFKVYYSPKLKELEDEIVRFCQVDLQVHNTRNGLRTLETVISISKRMGPFRVVETPTGSSHGVAGRQDLKVGLDMPIKELKTLLLKKEVQLLLLTAPGGCGKTTLVKMLCQDEEIKGTFKENILFVTVSKTPNVKLIIQSLFNYKSLWLGFQFQSDEDAIDSLPQLLNHIGPDPILLILDDVWLGSESLLEKFKFDIPDYKILVTSRTAFPRFEFTYHLKPLNDEDAMTLFRHSASLKEGSSYIPPEEDIKKIVWRQRSSNRTISEQLTLPEVETKSLIEHMKKGENLVRKCSKIPGGTTFSKVGRRNRQVLSVDLQVHNTRNGLRTLETVISISKRMGPFRVVETPTGSSHGVAGRQI
ncbi:putative disease resistance protein [Quercus suber]|uniref:Disease resistance protein n=1 Tax=Quercus suber TaxID=58331 RepID=A0AAW0IVU9_QUESU